MNGDESIPISITRSPTQVDDVVRTASRGRAPSVSALIAHSLSAPPPAEEQSTASSDAREEEEKKKKEEEKGEHLRGGGGHMPADCVDPRLSRSLMRGLSILTGFGPDGGARGIVELAGDLSMSPSTAHRYALTLVELGLLERCPKTRKYRLPKI
jgi:hypothetical protein